VRSAGNDTLVLETGEELSRSLNTRTWGRPVALGNVIVSSKTHSPGLWEQVGLSLEWDKEANRTLARLHREKTADSSRGISCCKDKHI
jgi:hypothetical protein